MICVHQVTKPVRRCCFSSLPVRAAVFSSPGSPALTTFHSEQQLVRARSLKRFCRSNPVVRRQPRSRRKRESLHRVCLVEVPRGLRFCLVAHVCTCASSDKARSTMLLLEFTSAGGSFCKSRPGDFPLRTAVCSSAQFKTVLSLQTVGRALAVFAW